MLSSFTVSTKANKEIIDITAKVGESLAQSNIKEGICLVFAQHTTCSVILGEYEAGLDSDFLNMTEQLKPRGPFKHAHDPEHAPSHLFSSAIGQQVSIPISSGQLSLGTWQKIMLLELDGPRERRILVQTIEEK